MRLLLISFFVAFILCFGFAEAQNLKGASLQLTPASLPTSGANGEVRVDTTPQLRIFSSGTWNTIGGANTFLSNLTAPTAINEPLLPSVTLTESLGSATKVWGETYSETYIMHDGVTPTIRGDHGVTSPSGGMYDSIYHSNAGDSFALFTSDHTAQTGSMIIETGNVSAGTDDSGAVSVKSGTSFGGERGKFLIDVSQTKMGTGSNANPFTSPGTVTDLEINSSDTKDHELHILTDSSGISMYASGSASPFANQLYFGSSISTGELNFMVHTGQTGMILRQDGSTQIGSLPGGPAYSASFPLLTVKSPITGPSDGILYVEGAVGLSPMELAKFRDVSYGGTVIISAYPSGESEITTNNILASKVSTSNALTIESTGSDIKLNPNTLVSFFSDLLKIDDDYFSAFFGDTRGFYAVSDGSGEPLTFLSQDVTSDTATNPVFVSSGSNNHASGAQSTGDAWFASGDMNGVSSTGDTGAVNVGSGSAVGSGDSGGLNLFTGFSGTGTTGAIIAASGAVNAATTTGALNFKSGNNLGSGGSGHTDFGSGTAGAGSTGHFFGFSGNTTSGNSGIVRVFSGNSTAGGNYGGADLFSGNVTSGISGDSRVLTGDGTSGTTGAIQIASGLVTTGTTGDVSVFSGLCSACSNTTGDVKVFSGASTSGSADSGVAQLYTGNTTSGTTGAVTVKSGNASAGSTGALNLFSGDATNTSGTITVKSGTGPVTRGHIILDGNRVQIKDGSTVKGDIKKDYTLDDMFSTVAVMNIEANAITSTGMSISTPSFAGNTGDIVLSTGHDQGAAALTGSVISETGASDSQSGFILNITGTVDGTGATAGNIGFITGSGIGTGDNSGSILLETGSATGTRGSVSVNAFKFLLDANTHFSSAQTTPPGTTTNANAGTGATSSVDATATDRSGIITLTTTNVASAAGVQMTVDFNTPFTGTVVCTVTNNDADSANFQVVQGIYFTASTTALSVNFATAEAVGRTYNWMYHCEDH